MADYRIKVTADSSAAKQELRKLSETVKRTTGDQKLNLTAPSLTGLSNRFKDLGSEIEVAKNGIREFYGLSKKLPVLGEKVQDIEDVAVGISKIGSKAPAAAKALKENGKAGTILHRSFSAASRTTESFVGNLAKMGFALYAVKEATGILQSAFGGFFQSTIGRQIQLRETVLKTQTALASTSKVFADGVEITDPFEKIVTLTESVEKHIDNIRRRSIELSGVTSGEVIEVFGMVAQQVGQIGGGLKEAEDLAVNFAAALGTFGIPLYQARQEIGSILRADITTDSYLAKALGITNQDIAKAKTETNGVMGFLEERLSAAVAGQRIAAEGFRGVTSNIAEIGEEIQRNFGMGLLDPLLNGLTKIFNAVYSISKELWNSSKAFGAGLGQLISTSVGSIGSGNSFIASLGKEIQELANGAEERIENTFVLLRSRAREFAQPVRDLLNEVIKIIILVGDGLKDLAIGFADISVESLKAAVSTLATLAQGFTAVAAVVRDLLSAYGDLLQLPVVQYFAQIGTTLGILNQIGLTTVVKLGLTAGLLATKWRAFQVFMAKVVAKIATVLGALTQVVGTALTRIAAAIKAFAVGIAATNPKLSAMSAELMKLATSMNTAGTAATKASAGMAGFAGATVAGIRAVSGAIWGFIKFNLAILAITVAIAAAMDAFNRFKRAQEDKRALEEINKKLEKRAELLKINKDELTEIQRRELAAANQALNDKYKREEEAVAKLNKALAELEERRERTLRGASGMMSGGTKFIDQQIEETKKKREEALKSLAKTGEQLDEDRIKRNITLEENKRIDLAKQIRDIELQYANDVFNARMQLERNKLQLIEAENSLLLQGVDNANAERLRGEEGASREALEALNAYFREKQSRELSAQQRERRFQLQIQDVEKKIADYRLNTQKKIDELRKKAGLRELEIAKKKAELEAKTITQADFDKFVDKRREESERDIEGLGLNPEYEELTRAGLQVQAQINEITDQLADLKDIGAIGDLIERLFPIESLERVKNAIGDVVKQLSARMDTGGVFDPEKGQIQVDLQRRIGELDRKRAVATNEIGEQWLNQVLNLEEYRNLMKEINKKHAEAVKKTKELADEQHRLNMLKKTEQAIALAQDSKASAEAQIQDMRTRHRLEMEGVREEMIQAQLEKDRLQRELDKRLVGVKNPGAREAVAGEAAKAMEAIDARARQASEGNDPLLQLFKQYKKEITDVKSMVSSLASTMTQELGAAMSDSVIALMDGTNNIQEILADMFKNIARAFIQMATQMIAKAIMMKALGIFLPGTGGGGAAPIVAPGEKYGPGFNTGGIASGPETGYTATLHGTEAVVPLPNGREIPVELSGGGGGPVNSVVNVTISDSGTTVNRNQASQLGRMIETSVMGILSRERRPGGILRS